MESLPLEILRMIMKHFSNAELATISLVNKCFKHEAHSLMSTRADLNADLDRPACHNSLLFLLHLKQMNVIPFSGIKFRWFTEDHSKLCPLPHKILNRPTHDILDRVAWRRLSISMHGRRLHLPKTCPALELVRKILRDFSSVLEELELNSHPKLLRFIQEIIQDRKFPQLKILKLHGSSSAFDRPRAEISFIKEMVARAPNLQEFHQDGLPNLSKNLLELSPSAVLVSNFNCFNPAHHEFSEGFTGTVKLKEIHFYYMAEFFSMERFKRTAPRILQSSCDTLRSIRINLVFLVPLMGYGGLCFNNVTNFLAYIDYHCWELAEPRVLSLLKQFDFNRIFPKLNKVQVGEVPSNDGIPEDYVTEFVNNAVELEEPPPDRAMNIKDLSIYEYFTAEAVSFLAAMFPYVEAVETNINCGERQVPYSLIWKHWPALQKLHGSRFSSAKELTGRTNENLDSEFCGIFPAEVALLREQEDEYLRAVHIVPVMPSITCLIALRTIRVVRRYDSPSGIPEEEMDPIFSKVTALIAFRRCRKLFVDIQTNSQDMIKALNPLLPYAEVQLVG